jgi:hypothetical protein
MLAAVSTPQAQPPSAKEHRPPAGRGRLIAARTLVVLAAILAFPGALAGYVRWQALDTNTFQSTAKQLIADDTVRNQVAETLVDKLYDNTDVSQSLEQKLPADQQALAAPITAATRLVADRAAPRLLERPRVQDLWVSALTEAQKRLVKVLKDDSTAIQTDNGDVVLDLRPLVVELGNRIAIVNNLAAQLPPDAGKVVILQSDQLETAQTLTSWLDTIGTWFWIIPVLLAIAGIALARGRRRVELRAVAIAAIIVGLLILVSRSLSGGYIVDALVKTESVKPAANRTWSILTALLTDTGWMLIGIGVVALFGVWIAGETTSGRAARRTMAPILGNRAWAFGSAAVLFLLLLWWQPVVQLGRPTQVLALAIVIAICVEALYRITVRDFPVESAIPPGASFRARWEARQARFGGKAPASSSIEDLERLSRLHDTGALTDEEYAGEKARLLART